MSLAPSAASAAPIVTAAYVPLPNPERLLDTRATGPIGAGQTVSVALTGAAPRPAAGSGVMAAVLNITALGPSAPGYWTVFPHDGALPDASNLNIDERAALDGDALAIPNLVTVPVGVSGIVDIFSSAGGNLLVDFLGYYAPAATSKAGRFVPLASPQRIVDTRTPARRPSPPTRCAPWPFPPAPAPRPPCSTSRRLPTRPGIGRCSLPDRPARTPRI